MNIFADDMLFAGRAGAAAAALVGVKVAPIMSHQTATKTLAHDTRRLNLRKLEDLDTFEAIFARASEKITPPITKQSQFPNAANPADPPSSPGTRPSPDNPAPSHSPLADPCRILYK